jgi:hypothetical protein
MEITIMQVDLGQLYDLITGEDDKDRVCDPISEEACTNVPRNFFLNVLNGSTTKLGDKLGSPSLVLPWLLDALGAPAFLTGLLVPIRQSLALLPQLAIAGQIRRFARRKWFWAGGGLGFGLSFFLMLLAVLALPPSAAGIAIVFFLALGSMSRGVSSVAFKDVLAKTIPQRRRGTLLAARAASAGALTLGAGLLLRAYVAEVNAIGPFLALLAATAVLWSIGAGLAAAVEEEKGATQGGRNALQEARVGWGFLRQQAGFRRFITARALLLSVQLSVPFYSLYARQLTGGNISGLGVFVIAIGLADVFSSPFWGRFADRSSRTVMIWGGSLAVVVGLVMLGVGVFLPAAWHTAIVLSPIFLVVGFAQAGVRLGRKAYIVNAAPGPDRPTYVALTNTIIGVLTLAGGAFGVVADAYSVPALLIVFIGLTTLGVVLAWRMPEAEDMVSG